MAARKNKYCSNETREKIQGSLLVNKLMAFVNGDIKLEKSQVTAALGLLKKVLPDLSSTQMSGPDGGPLEVSQSISVQDQEIINRHFERYIESKTKKEPK
jgi:hypothetical protein